MPIGFEEAIHVRARASAPLIACTLPPTSCWRTLGPDMPEPTPLQRPRLANAQAGRQQPAAPGVLSWKGEIEGPPALQGHGTADAQACRSSGGRETPWQRGHPPKPAAAASRGGAPVM